MRHAFVRACLAVGAAAALLTAGASTGAATATTTGDVDPLDTRSVDIPLEGTFGGSSCGANENIDVTGSVHITVNIGDTGGIKGVTNLVNTSGTGETSGLTYRFTGAESFRSHLPGRPKPTTLTLTPIFQIHRPGAAPNPCQFVFETIDIAADGSITNISANVFTPESGG